MAGQKGELWRNNLPAAAADSSTMREKVVNSSTINIYTVPNCFGGNFFETLLRNDILP